MKKIIILAFIFSVFFRMSIVFGQSADTAFKPSGKFSGQFFGDYAYKAAADQSKRGVGQYSGMPKAFSILEIRRVYLGYNYTISPDFTTEFLLAYEQNLDGSGNRGFYLKLANIRWVNIFKNADVIFGAQSTPAWSFLAEKIWGYRAVEKTIMDKNKLGSSNDLGIALQGAFDDAKDFGYDFLYGNGTGSKPETDRYKKMYGDIWGKFFDKKVIIQLYGDLNRLKPVPEIDGSTIKLFLAYQTDPITFGLEGFLQTQEDAVTDSNIATNELRTRNLQSFGFSAFVSGNMIAETLRFFARFDLFDPDRKFNSSSGFVYKENTSSPSKESFMTAGLDWTPFATVHIIPNIWLTNYSSKLISTQDPLKSGTDVVGRVTISYKY